MFLTLSHMQMDVYIASKELILACYKETKIFPPEEKFGITSQIRRAVLSVHFNIAEGCSRKSSRERNRFFEIARGSLVEVDTALGIATGLEYTSRHQLKSTGQLILRCFQMISKMIT